MKKIADISSFDSLQAQAHQGMGLPVVAVWNMSEEDPIYQACNAWDWERFKALVQGKDPELDDFIAALERKQQGHDHDYSDDFLSSLIEMDYNHPDKDFWELWRQNKDDLYWPRLQWQYDEEEANTELYPYILRH